MHSSHVSSIYEPENILLQIKNLLRKTLLLRISPVMKKWYQLIKGGLTKIFQEMIICLILSKEAAEIDVAIINLQIFLKNGYELDLFDLYQINNFLIFRIIQFKCPLCSFESEMMFLCRDHIESDHEHWKDDLKALPKSSKAPDA